MNLTGFLLTTFLVACLFSTINDKRKLTQKNEKLENTVLTKDSLINQIQESNCEYIDIALNCNANHKNLQDGNRGNKTTN